MWRSPRPWLRTLVVAACLMPLMSTTAQAASSEAASSEAASSEAASSEVSAFDAVNQFIGTELDPTQNKSNDAYGNTFPGASVPFGMVQPSPTTYKANDGNGEKGGYEYTASLIRGFGMTRYSGTGCTGRYGGYEFPTIPYAGALTDATLPVSPATNVRDYFLPFSHATRRRSPATTG